MPIATRKLTEKASSSKPKRQVKPETRATRKRSTPGAVTSNEVVVDPVIKPVFAKLFQNGRSQAVRLPKEFRFEGKEVQVSRQGDGILLTPLDTRTTQQYWDDLFAKLDEFKDIDFPDCEDDSVTQPEDIFPEGW